MEFNKKGFGAFREDVQKALAEVADKHGVDIKCGKINYSAYNFTMQLDVTKNDENTDGKKAIFAQLCRVYGFEPSDYEREFTLNGRKFKLVGFNTKSPKNCCSIVDVFDGHTYKCNNEPVKRAFIVESK